MSGRRRRGWGRRLAGAVWLAAWASVLHAVTDPWRDLGGLVDERLRWLVWLVLPVGLCLGHTIGRFGRDAATAGTGTTHASLLRLVLYPPAALAAACLVLLAALGHRDPAGVVVVALAAYWAGTDLALAALPLLRGEPYRFARPIDPDPSDDLERRLERGRRWVPPWERY